MAEIRFLMGPEEGEKLAWLEGEKRRLAGLHPDMEVVNLFAFDTDPAALEESLFSSSLFSSFTLVVLKHYEELKKDSPVNRVILKYVQDKDSPNALIVLSSQTTYSLPAALSKALSRDMVISFWEMFENKKQDWIRSFFRKEGYQISQDAIRYILDMIENNTWEMKNTCSQLALFFQLSGTKGQIGLDEISSYLSHTREEDGFSLFACIARADLAKSLSCLKKILDSDRNGHIGLTGVLLRQFRLLESFSSLRSGGEEAAFSNASAFSSSAAPVRGIKTQRDKATFKTAADNYTLEDTGRIIRYLDGMDVKVKMAAADEVSLTLELMLYTIIVNRGRVTTLRLERELLDNPLGHSERD